MRRGHCRRSRGGHPFHGSEGDGRPLAVGTGASEHLRDRYDEEIHFLDRQLGVLFHELAALDLWSSTVLVIASDHGESFVENGRIEHCNGVHDAEPRVPLLLRVPGLAKGDSPEPWVENLDIAPTGFDVLGLARRASDSAVVRWYPPG